MKADPFASISDLCHVSSSQEDRLSRCRFAHEPDDEVDEDDEEAEEYYRDAPAGIIMVSPPDSDELNDDNTPQQFTDIFQTPPEGSFLSSPDDRRDGQTGFVEEGTAAGRSEGEKTIDLGADTDLGFSEVELTQRIDCQNEVIGCQLDTVRDLKRELAMKECDSQFKKPKTLDENLNLESPNQCLEAELGESRDQLNSNRSVQNDKNGETEVLELGSEASDGVLGCSECLESDRRNRGGGNKGDCRDSRNLGRKSIEDIDKYRYVGPSANREMMRTKGMRALPASVLGEPESGRNELDSGKNHSEITLLDVLRMLAKRCGYDRSLENKSILDVAKSRGMTFP